MKFAGPAITKSARACQWLVMPIIATSIAVEFKRYVTIIDATRDPSSAGTYYVMGAATEWAQHEKMVQHKTWFPRLDVLSQLRVAAFDVRGDIST